MVHCLYRQNAFDTGASLAVPDRTRYCPANIPSEYPAMSLRLALCGCSQALQWSDCLRRLDGVSVTTVADADPTVAEAAAPQFGTGSRVTSCDQLLSAAGDDWDALVISGELTGSAEVTQNALAWRIPM